MRSIILFCLFGLSFGAFSQQADTTIRINESAINSNGEEIYETYLCDERAMFPGGDSCLIQYISENVQFPSQLDIEGKVFVRFEITKNGEIGQVKILRSVDPFLDNEAIRVVKSLPKWKPAIIKGIPVNSWFIVPVRFGFY